MKITILTLFPEMFTGPFDHSILKRAKERGLLEINFVNIRDFGIGKHQVIDDTPYGGGVGMVMRVDVLHEAIKNAQCPMTNDQCREKTILLSASGKTFKQSTAKEYSGLDHLILICGHYEGVDDRIKHYIDEEISIGDFVLTGGEIPAMLITDAVVRLINGVITDGATEDESFSQNGDILLEYPHYTRPQTYQDDEVPEILLSGNHPKINAWRKEKALEKTKKIRPDLLRR
jgi:tRNA (guanine37-N1)-methyltransferase